MLIFPGTQGILLSVSLVSSFLHKQHLDLKKKEKEKERKKKGKKKRKKLKRKYWSKSRTLTYRDCPCNGSSNIKRHTCIMLLHFLENLDLGTLDQTVSQSSCRKVYY